MFLAPEFPFPGNEDDRRTPPGRLMRGVQFFESHIGCQLLPSGRYAELPDGHGFRDIRVINVNPVHAVVYGTK